MLFVPLLLAGCGGEEPEPEPPPAAPAPPPPKPVEKPVDPVKPVEKVEEKLTPHVKVTIDQESIESEKFIATLHLGVLQVQNYDADAKDVFPQVFFWSNAAANNFKSLEGNTVDAQVVVQKSAEPWPIHAMGDATVKLKITKVTDAFIVGEVSEGKVFDSEAGRSIPLKCEFVAEIK